MNTSPVDISGHSVGKKRPIHTPGRIRHDVEIGGVDSIAHDTIQNRTTPFRVIGVEEQIADTRNGEHRDQHGAVAETGDQAVLLGDELRRRIGIGKSHVGCVAESQPNLDPVVATTGRARRHITGVYPDAGERIVMGHHADQPGVGHLIGHDDLVSQALKSSAGHILRSTFATVLAVVVGAVLLAACTTSVSTDSGAPGTSAAPGGGAAGTPPPDTHGIAWSECEDATASFECATVPVPIDHSQPDGATLDLALVRLPAPDRSKVIGPLFVNPGGPGGSGIDFVQGNFWPRELTDHFDIIGFDPRGVGASDPVDCDFDIGELYAPDPAPPTPAAVDALTDVSKQYVQACTENNAALLPHMGTRDVAADMDLVRAALGDDQLNYLGFSYGTSIGQVYLDTYPDHVRAMVLDGVVRLGQDGLDAAQAQGEAFDDVLGEFFAACPSIDGCPRDAAATLRQVRADLRKHSLPTDDADRDLTSGTFQLGVGQALYVTAFWPTLAQGLTDAAAGDGTTLLDLSDQYLGRNADGSYDNQTDAYFAVSCLDWDWPDNPGAFIQAGRDVAKTSPYLAEGIVTDYIRCAWWPTPPQPLTPPVAEGSPLVVVVSTTGDPATPHQNGVDLAADLPDARLITKVGDDHVAYGRGDRCVDDPVAAYLISLRPPAEGLRCS